MTIKDGKYPNKEDLEPKVPKQGKPAGPADELPLSDPADSNFTHEYLENEPDKMGEQVPSVFKENEEKISERTHNEKAHTEWNESKRNT
ncbi:hypothetical protein DVB69_13970 [Sporosarcina sp. BI001-red]|uniref:hypothetical protein n=1 Tax=Sporosarcina sp. BI001-red TaxID=2282866 RepID=UPI000E2444D0|nr:hypothetical protein [Sporosarcina sp. BI001-red]REB06038.1 hypothetical protein DVB69_13970 [Sporosarcina sp. BI001-red]